MQDNEPVVVDPSSAQQAISFLRNLQPSGEAGGERGDRQVRLDPTQQVPVVSPALEQGMSKLDVRLGSIQNSLGSNDKGGAELAPEISRLSDAVTQLTSTVAQLNAKSSARAGSDSSDMVSDAQQVTQRALSNMEGLSSASQQKFLPRIEDPLAGITPYANRHLGAEYISPTPGVPYYMPVTRPNLDMLQQAGRLPSGMPMASYGMQSMSMSAPGAQVMPMMGMPAGDTYAPAMPGINQQAAALLGAEPETLTDAIAASTGQPARPGMVRRAMDITGGIATTAGRTVKNAASYLYSGIVGEPTFYEADLNRPETRGMYGGMHGSVYDPSLLQTVLQRKSFANGWFGINADVPRNMTTRDYLRENDRAWADKKDALKNAALETALDMETTMGTLGAVAGGAVGGLPGSIVGGLLGSTVGKVGNFVTSPWRERAQYNRQLAQRSRAAVGDLFLGMEGAGLDPTGRVSVQEGYAMGNDIFQNSLYNKQNWMPQDIGLGLERGVAKGIFDTSSSVKQIRQKLPSYMENMARTMQYRNARSIEEATDYMAGYTRRGGADVAGSDYLQHTMNMGILQRQAGLQAWQSDKVSGESAMFYMQEGLSGNVGAAQGLLGYDLTRRARRTGALSNYDMMRFGGEENFKRQAIADQANMLQGPVGSLMSLATTGQVGQMARGGLGVPDMYINAANNIGTGDVIQNLFEARYNRQKMLSNNMEQMERAGGPYAQTRQELNMIKQMGSMYGLGSDGQMSEGEFIGAADTLQIGEARARQLYGYYKKPGELRRLEAQSVEESAKQAAAIKEQENSMMNALRRGSRQLANTMMNGASMPADVVESIGKALMGVITSGVKGAVRGNFSGGVLWKDTVRTLGLDAIGISSAYSKSEMMSRMKDVHGEFLDADPERKRFFEEAGVTRGFWSRMGGSLWDSNAYSARLAAAGPGFGSQAAAIGGALWAGLTGSREGTWEGYGRQVAGGESSYSAKLQRVSKMTSMFKGVDLKQFTDLENNPAQLFERNVDMAKESKALGLTADQGQSLLDSLEQLSSKAGDGGLDVDTLSSFVDSQQKLIGFSDKTARDMKNGALTKFAMNTTRQIDLVQNLQAQKAQTEHSRAAMNMGSAANLAAKAGAREQMDRIAASSRINFTKGGATVGGLIGAGIGGFLGSLVAPIFGTAIGATVGGGIGAGIGTGVGWLLDKSTGWMYNKIDDVRSEELENKLDEIEDPEARDKIREYLGKRATGAKMETGTEAALKKMLQKQTGSAASASKMLSEINAIATKRFEKLSNSERKYFASDYMTALGDVDRTARVSRLGAQVADNGIISKGITEGKLVKLPGMEDDSDYAQEQGYRDLIVGAYEDLGKSGWDGKDINKVRPAIVKRLTALGMKPSDADAAYSKMETVFSKDLLTGKKEAIERLQRDGDSVLLASAKDAQAAGGATLAQYLSLASYGEEKKPLGPEKMSDAERLRHNLGAEEIKAEDLLTTREGKLVVDTEASSKLLSIDKLSYNQLKTLKREAQKMADRANSGEKGIAATGRLSILHGDTSVAEKTSPAKVGSERLASSESSPASPESSRSSWFASTPKTPDAAAKGLGEAGEQLGTSADNLASVTGELRGVTQDLRRTIKSLPPVKPTA